jgi:hypothetical protein
VKDDPSGQPGFDPPRYTTGGSRLNSGGPFDDTQHPSILEHNDSFVEPAAHAGAPTAAAQIATGQLARIREQLADSPVQRFPPPHCAPQHHHIEADLLRENGAAAVSAMIQFQNLSRDCSKPALCPGFHTSLRPLADPCQPDGFGPLGAALAGREDDRRIDDIEQPASINGYTVGVPPPGTRIPGPNPADVEPQAVQANDLLIDVAPQRYAFGAPPLQTLVTKDSACRDRNRRQ